MDQALGITWWKDVPELRLLAGEGLARNAVYEGAGRVKTREVLFSLSAARPCRVHGRGGSAPRVKVERPQRSKDERP